MQGAPLVDDGTVIHSGDTLGGDLLALPIIFIGNAFFTLAGWAYGLKEKSTLQKENERLLAIISKASAEK